MKSHLDGQTRKLELSHLTLALGGHSHTTAKTSVFLQSFVASMNGLPEFFFVL